MPKVHHRNPDKLAAGCREAGRVLAELDAVLIQVATAGPSILAGALLSPRGGPGGSVRRLTLGLTWPQPYDWSRRS